jgi:autoinducer 2-degrading protein
MIVLAVLWIAKQGQEGKAAELFRQLTAASRKEPGCAMFIVHRHKDDPLRFFIYEQYRDETALEEHRNTKHFQQIARGELLDVAERLEGALYTPME